MTQAKCLARVKRAVDAVSSLPFSFLFSLLFMLISPCFCAVGHTDFVPKVPACSSVLHCYLHTHTHTHTPLYITEIKDMASLSPNLAQFLNHPKFPLVQKHFSMTSRILKG